jgi:hypothetical protein
MIEAIRIAKGKLGRVWFVTTDQGVYVSDPQDQRGFGGALIDFKIGAFAVQAKGPYASNWGAYEKDTAI